MMLCLIFLVLSNRADTLQILPVDMKRMSSTVDGFNQNDLPAPSPGPMGNSQDTEFDIDSTNQDHVAQASYMASIDATIPVVAAEGCSVPKTPILSPLLVGGISMIAATQSPSGYHIRVRPRIDRFVNAPSRYRSPFKCISPRPEINLAKAEAVRMKFCTELKDQRNCVLSGTSTYLRCNDVAESFSDGAELYKAFMSFFIECIREEESIYRPACVGYRVFISANVGDMLNRVYVTEPKNPPYDLAAFIKLWADTDELDLNRVKLFFVPVIEKEYYYTVYCLNMVDCRIDILDSSNDEHIDYHTIVSDRVVPRLNDLFQRLTDAKFKDFSRLKRPITKVMREKVLSDSAFIAMKVIQIWDGNKLHLQNQTSMSELRSEMLYYMLYHPHNQRKMLPYGLEEYRQPI